MMSQAKLKAFSITQIQLLLFQALLLVASTSATSGIRNHSEDTMMQQPRHDAITTTTHRPRRSLATAVDGITACKSCDASSGHKCVGRTVQDENCANCASGQEFWPCNLKKECWCWDTSLPRDPGDEDSKERACNGCGRESDTEVCASNQNSLVPVDDGECEKCVTEGQSFWPCDDPDLCWCWDTTKPKKPPAPASGLSLAIDVDPNVPSPCEVLTYDMFMKLAPNSTHPYTYEGLCKAIDDYNMHHTEKFAAMGTIEHIKAEISSFLGNTAHESDDFEAGREYLACGDRKEVDGKVYCKPCTNDLYDWPNNVCSVSMVDQNAPYNSYCQPGFQPPEGCVCDTITQVEEDGPLAGYVEASKVFYGRGAIQLSWNYNYIRASYALTGNAETFCEDPELVATNPEYAWGAGIYFWMENQKEGSTCHKEALRGDFGGTLNNINGGLECPAYKGGWHYDAVKMRLNRYCHAAAQLKLASIMSLDGCAGMQESFDECLEDGLCPYCKQYAGVESHTFDDMSGVVTSDAKSKPESPVPPTRASTVAPTNTMASVTSPPVLPPALLQLEPMIPAPSPPVLPPALDQLESLETFTFSSSPSPTTSPTTGQPSMSPIINPTGTPTTATPTYSPTTPQPTLGPCSGEACAGNFCRSAFGFCGGGDSYCNDSAIWSPECKRNTSVPTPQPTTGEPTESPISNAILDGVFSITTARPPIASPVAPVGTPTNQFPATPVDTPTNSLAEPSTTSKGTPFSKPSGGKKPLGGKGKPSQASGSSSQQSQLTGATEKEQLPTPPPSPPPMINPTPSPSSKAAEEVYSPTDPEATYFCGENWQDANTLCSVRCPSSKSDECPTGEKCFAYTTCMQQTSADTGEPTDQPTPSPIKNLPVTSTTSIREPTVPPPMSGDDGTTTPDEVNEDEMTPPEGCNGTPCPFHGECRSQYGFCGYGFIYCNSLSSWTLEKCGLYAAGVDGEPVLCDAEVHECPDGEQVYQNPGDNCEYFPCPVGKEEEAVMAASFFAPKPAPGPSLPQLPRPTLPTIREPSPFTSTGVVYLNKKPTWGTSEDREDDDDDNEPTQSSEDSGPSWSNKDSNEMEFGSFSAQDWLASSRNDGSSNRKFTGIQVLTLAIFITTACIAL